MANLPEFLGLDAEKIRSCSSLWDTLFQSEDRTSLALAFDRLGTTNAKEILDTKDVHSLSNLLGWIAQKDARSIGYRIIFAGDALVSPESTIVGLHFFFASRGDFFYRWREEDAFAIDEAILSYQKQIGLSSNAFGALHSSLPDEIRVSHRGFHQLRVIEEKRQNYTLALALCERAKADGWGGSWDKDIERIRKKMAKGPTIEH